MARRDDYVFVLWGDRFEEAPATIFITELRQAGLRVKIVGITPRPILGTHGLGLIADLTLDQALPLAAQARCIIIPLPAPDLHRLKNDPRLQQFFDLAHQNQASFVVGPLKGVALHELELFPVSALDAILVYPEREPLLGFARELPRSLLADNSVTDSQGL